MTVAMAVGDEWAPRTFSSRRITLAGEKKCVPITLSGRFVAEAISFTSSVEALVARIASGFAMPSSFANTSFLIGISSNTASITMSASFTALKSVVPVMRPMRFLLHFDDGDGDADVREVHRDAAAHRAGADDRRLLDLLRGRARRHVGDLRRLALGEEEVALRLRLQI